MPYLAARVPQGWDVINQWMKKLGEIDWNIEVDSVVGITFHTPSAFHAYNIATRYGRGESAWRSADRM